MQIFGFFRRNTKLTREKNSSQSASSSSKHSNREKQQHRRSKIFYFIISKAHSPTWDKYTTNNLAILSRITLCNAQLQACFECRLNLSLDYWFAIIYIWLLYICEIEFKMLNTIYEVCILSRKSDVPMSLSFTLMISTQV